MSKCWHAAAAQEQGMETRREGRMWWLLLCICSSKVNRIEERCMVLLEISYVLEVIFLLSSWQNMCTARWELWFLTDVLVGVSSGFAIYAVSLKRWALSLAPMGQWVVNGTWVTWSCSAAGLTWWLVAMPTLDAPQSLPPLPCDISYCEAAAGSLLYIMPALVHLEST